MSTVCTSCSTQLLAEATGLGTIAGYWRLPGDRRVHVGYVGALQPLQIGMRLEVRTRCPVQWACAPGALWPFGASDRPQPDSEWGAPPFGPQAVVSSVVVPIGSACLLPLLQQSAGGQRPLGLGCRLLSMT